MEFLEIGFRTVLLYFVMLIIFRIMGKREIGELSILDLIVFIMLGELGVVAIIDFEKSLWHQLVPMFIIVLIQIVLALVSLKSEKFRHLLDGEPTIIVRDGKIDEKQMRKQRYNMNDLLTQLREDGVGDVRDVQYAILETSGRLSVFRKKVDSTPEFTLPLIVDGEVHKNHLQMLDQSEGWLYKRLNELGYDDIGEISYCTFQNGEFFVDMKDK